MTVISVENLSKQYDLGVIGTGTISRDLNRWWARVRGKPDPYSQIGQKDAFERIGESILALDDVSFQVKQGEALGIIGRNGAGKSTLLKILSRVTAPTSGVVKVKGRIGSLLEVGTGFHPELTGRENVYLNGAILGMRKEEITRRFDEIVDFSGVEKFIDTPVKRYSSGMYVRLAFAVAAHLDPEILIVDEVLAVGDAEFQKKCLGKMGDVAGEGRTVLFVSHNMAAIQNLCDSTMLLESGSITKSGETEEVISHYLTDNLEVNVFNPENSKRHGDQTIRIEEFSINPTLPQTGGPLEFELIVNGNNNLRSKTSVDFAIGIRSMRNEKVLHLYSKNMGEEFVLGAGKSKVTTSMESLPLAPGDYKIFLWVGSGLVTFDFLEDCYTMSVKTGNLNGGSYVESKGYSLIATSAWELKNNEQ